jgi:transcriptional regulator of acetoin/glycerol metabolism
VCSTDCAHAYSKVLRAKKRRKERAEFRARDKQTLLKRVQALFNKFIRLRDAKEPCISCGYTGNGRQWHAGHYRPQGRNGALRFNKLNCHKQCSICNNYLSGNLVNYRANLIKKIGLEMVEELENNNEVKRWTVQELQEMEAVLKMEIRELENAKNN